MKNLLFVVFLGSTFTTILAESHSKSCSMVNGKWSCREMSNEEGHSAVSSSFVFNGSGDASTYEGVATGSRDGLNWDQGGTGMFSGVYSPGGSRIFSGSYPYGGIGILPDTNPYGNADIFSGVNPSDGTDTFSGVNPSYGTDTFSGVNPSYGTDTFSGVNPSDGTDTFSAVNPSDGIDTFSAVNPSDGIDTFSGVNPSDGTDIFSGLNPSFGNSKSEDSNPSSDADDSTVHPEVTQPPVFNPSSRGFVPLGTFAAAGSGVYPGIFNPFAGAVATSGIPLFFGPPAFAGAARIPRFPLGYFGVPAALAYAGK